MEKFLNIKLINKQKKNLVLPLNLFLRREQNTFIFSLLVRIRFGSKYYGSEYYGSESNLKGMYLDGPEGGGGNENHANHAKARFRIMGQLEISQGTRWVLTF